MKKFAAGCVVALMGLLTIAVLAPAAQAYPEVAIDLSVDRTVLHGGEQFTATGSSSVDCAWTAEWNGEVHRGAGSPGSPYVTSYTAPEVSDVTKIPLHGTCRYADPAPRIARQTAGRAAAATEVWKRTIMITVLPNGSAAPPAASNGADLPNTGGPSWIVFVGGLVLFFSGVVAVRVARRRAEIVDIATGQA